jgi:DNA/RNA-binding domain of Phe-tRNA-synthetase-like protein
LAAEPGQGVSTAAGGVMASCVRKKGRSSFLKKRSKRLLQMAVLVPPARSATATDTLDAVADLSSGTNTHSGKSLLVLFFRKERLSFLN